MRSRWFLLPESLIFPNHHLFCIILGMIEYGTDAMQVKGTGKLPNRACAVLFQRLQAPIKPRCCAYPYRANGQLQIHCLPCGEAMDQLLVAK